MAIDLRGRGPSQCHPSSLEETAPRKSRVRVQGTAEKTRPQPFLPLGCLLTVENIFISHSFDFNILRKSLAAPHSLCAKCHCLVLMAPCLSPQPSPRMGQTGQVTDAFSCICHSPQGEGCFLPQILKSYHP